MMIGISVFCGRKRQQPLLLLFGVFAVKKKNSAAGTEIAIASRFHGMNNEAHAVTNFISFVGQMLPKHR